MVSVLRVLLMDRRLLAPHQARLQVEAVQRARALSQLTSPAAHAVYMVGPCYRMLKCLSDNPWKDKHNRALWSTAAIPHRI